VAEISQDLSRLIHQEIELAKAEMREEVTKAAKAAGMFGGAGFAGYLSAVVGAFAAVFGLAYEIGLAWGAVCVMALLAGIGALLFLRGKVQLHKIQPRPERTVESLKEDAEWAKHPTS